jgi:hypothetical protein
MGPLEIANRLRDETIKARWRRRKPPSMPAAGQPSFRELGVSPASVVAEESALAAIERAAEGLLAGRLSILGREVALPKRGGDWFIDPDTGLQVPGDRHAFSIDMRDSAAVGNHKYLLEPARLQQATLLAAGFFLTRREAFAELAAAQLRSWWTANPFLSGVHWTSGIEAGLRLVSMAWTRRLLAGWRSAAECFEGSSLALGQIYDHQHFLARLPSRGSSANNHLIAELLGRFVAASAFPWYPETAGWLTAAAEGLEVEATRQVFADGLDREQASDYHSFVLEMLMVAAAEAVFAGHQFSQGFLETIARMADGLAATLDVRFQPPRQGDTDNAVALMLDPPNLSTRALSLLSAAAMLVGACPWWPPLLQDFRCGLFAVLCRGAAPSGSGPRPSRRSSSFPGAGLALLRDLDGRADELWCRCDHGPHGYLSIAGHAHADALSVEVRHGGVELLCDPGTYCYQTEPEFRRYFKSTIGHNTLEIGGADQARYGGPFLWLTAPRTELLELQGLDDGARAHWAARHDGYSRLPGRPRHERSVSLDRRMRQLTIKDRIIGAGRFQLRLAYHLGPEIEAEMDAGTLYLQWRCDGRLRRGQLVLPQNLNWRQFKGSNDPVLGWHSRKFGQRQPSITWVGEGSIAAGATMAATLIVESEN